MQVEGLKNHSNGRLTTSLIAPVTSASPPKSQMITFGKPVELGPEQRGNGKVRYRVGSQISISGEQNLRELKAFVGQPIANGRVPISPTNEHLHLYAKMHEGKDSIYFVHLVIEDRAGGLIAADIAAVSNGVSVGHVSGLVSDQAKFFAPDDENVMLESMSSDSDNVITLHTEDGKNVLINLGKLDELVVDCGVIDRVGDQFQTHRTETGIKIYSRDDMEVTEDPFGYAPIATLERSLITSEFKHSLVPVLLKPEVAAGFVRPAPEVSGSVRGF